MSKELTEQWRKGKLPIGSYYIKIIGDVERVDFFDGLEWERTKDYGVGEVLAPVPEYYKFLEYYTGNTHWKKECKRLQEQLKDTMAGN